MDEASANLIISQNKAQKKPLKKKRLVSIINR